MKDSLLAEGIRLNARMDKHGITFDALVKATGKRPHYLDRVVKGIYPITRPVCAALDELIGDEKGTTFELCTKGGTSNE